MILPLVVDHEPRSTTDHHRDSASREPQAETQLLAGDAEDSVNSQSILLGGSNHPSRPLEVTPYRV
jgi:hypothetical protein